MKINFDVTAIELKIIRGILSNYLYSNCKVWVFGSRAKTSSLHGSDLDLALDCINKMDLKILNKIKSDLENSRLPYKVDVVDINGVKPYFKEIIDKEKIPLPVEIKREVPLLRFKEFSGKWEEKDYGDIYSFYFTNSLPRDKLNYKNGKVYNIHYGDIHTKFSTMFKLEKEIVPYVNMDIDLSKLKDENYCQVGDLVIADASEDYNDIGKTMEIISLNNKQTISGLHTFLARPNKYNMALGYAGYMLQSSSIRRQIERIAQGTKVLSLSVVRLLKIKLNLPQQQEQQKITSFLTMVNTRIEQLNIEYQLLEKYKKAIIQKIFSQNFRFKNDDGSEFACWKIKVFEELFNSVSGTALEEFTDTNSAHRFISIGNYGIEGQYIDNGQRVALNEKTKTKLLNKNDLVMVLNDKTLSGDIIGSTILIHQNDKYIYNQRSERLICNNNIMPLFAWYYLISLKFRKKVFTVSQGGTQIYINFSSIKKFKINLPPFKEQTKIANFLSSIDKKITNSSNQSSKKI